MLAIVALAGCAPELVPPGESIRVDGRVVGEGAPVRVVVHEQCSPWLFVFEKCPGTRLGSTKIGRTGPFLLEVDSKRPVFTVFAWEERPGIERECGAQEFRPDGATASLEVPLAGAECPPEPPVP